MKRTIQLSALTAALIGAAGTITQAQLRENTAPAATPVPAVAPAPTPAVSGEYEEPPILRASAILRPEFFQGPRFSVADSVLTYAGHNRFTISSDSGVWEANGNTELIQRISEINAIARLSETSRTDEYKEALRKAARSPVDMAGELARNPVKTVAGVPKGVWKFLNRTGQTIKEASHSRERSPYEDAPMESLIGFSKAKREVAFELGVDPYSSNEALQKELNGVAWASFGGSMTIRLALAPAGGGAGVAISAFNLTETTLQSLKDLSPNDLRRENLGKLLKIEVPREDANTFLNNPAFSPTHQTAIVGALEQLNGAAWRSEFIYLCKDAADETEALYYQRCAKLMAKLHGEQPLARIGSLRGFPIALAADGTMIVPIEWDYITWTKPAADFARTLQTIPWGTHKITGRRVVITGVASPKTKEQLAALGIQLVEKALPGPLL